MSRVEVTDGRRVADRGRHNTASSVSPGIVGQRPAMNRVGGKPLLLPTSRHGIGEKRKRTRVVSPGSPAGRGTFNIRVEDLSASVQPQRNRIGCSPFIERVAVEETHQDVELATRAVDCPRGREPVVECPGRNSLGVISRLSSRVDKPSQFARPLTACMMCGTEPEVLLHGFPYQDPRSIVVGLPARVLVKGLTSILGNQRPTCRQGHDTKLLSHEKLPLPGPWAYMLRKVILRNAQKINDLTP